MSSIRQSKYHLFDSSTIRSGWIKRCCFWLETWEFGEREGDIGEVEKLEGA